MFILFQFCDGYKIEIIGVIDGYDIENKPLTMGKRKQIPNKSAAELAADLQHKILLKEIKDYQNTLKHYLMTSRFNTQTLQENRNFVEKSNTVNCVYCCPDPIAKHIPLDTILFVLEMNNDTNMIAGIGLVKNHAFMHKYNVYSERSYNRYIYYGKHHIARENMTEEEDRIMKVFDILCFTGNKHMKRGQGVKSFPVETLFKCKNTLDLVKFISEMFKTRIQKQESVSNY